MLSPRIDIKRNGSDEAEKPFWISYADLMTSLMVLFLVVMLASLLALTQSVRAAAKINTENEQQAKELKSIREREKAFNDLRTRVQSQLAQAAKAKGLKFRDGDTVDFGTRALFDKNKDSLTGPQIRVLRDFAPDVVRIANSVDGKKVISSVVVEGFASPEGTYLDNLDLSARRSERALCALLEPGNPSIPTSMRESIRALFTTAGASSNSFKKDAKTSRRIEMRIDYYQKLDKNNARGRAAPLGTGGMGSCALGA